MKTESNLRPEEFSIIDLPNGTSEILFCENIEEIEDDRYYFDMYITTVATRENLSSYIESNYESWIEYAKNNQTNPLDC